MFGIPSAAIVSKLSQSKRINQIFVVQSLFNTLNVVNVYLHYNSDLGGTVFLISSILFGVFDFASTIMCYSMVYAKLLPDSRGVVLSILNVAVTFAAIIQSVGIIQI